MERTLNTCIDNYIEQSTTPSDKKTAQHLKTVIPMTKHLETTTFNHFKEALLQENTNTDFKDAFITVSPRFVLKGNIITAELPNILTRIILNKANFITFLKRSCNIPFSTNQIESVLALGDNEQLIRLLLNNINLSKHKVVFATFHEENLANDPFANHSVKDIINLLALDQDVFESGRPLSAIKIRYHNRDSFTKRFPTFIDAGWWDKFFPAHENDNYGRTKCLDGSPQGMPELVHQNVRIPDVLESIEVLEDRQWN